MKKYLVYLIALFCFGIPVRAEVTEQDRAQAVLREFNRVVEQLHCGIFLSGSYQYLLQWFEVHGYSHEDLRKLIHNFVRTKSQVIDFSDHDAVFGSLIRTAMDAEIIDFILTEPADEFGGFLVFPDYQGGETFAPDMVVTTSNQADYPVVTTIMHEGAHLRLLVIKARIDKDSALLFSGRDHFSAWQLVEEFVAYKHQIRHQPVENKKLINLFRVHEKEKWELGGDIFLRTIFIAMKDHQKTLAELGIRDVLITAAKLKPAQIVYIDIREPTKSEYEQFLGQFVGELSE